MYVRLLVVFGVTTSCDLQNMLAYTQSIFHSIYIYISLSPFSLSFLFIRHSILTVELSHITVELALYDSIRDSNVENRDYRQKTESDFFFFS